jgi:hypothetical protein
MMFICRGQAGRQGSIIQSGGAKYRTEGRLRQWSSRRAQSQDRQWSKPGGCEKSNWGEKQALTQPAGWLDKQDELATDKHRYKYTGVNGEDGQHLEGVETITRTGGTDQGVTLWENKPNESIGQTEALMKRSLDQSVIVRRGPDPGCKAQPPHYLPGVRDPQSEPPRYLGARSTHTPAGNRKCSKELCVQ